MTGNRGTAISGATEKTKRAGSGRLDARPYGAPARAAPERPWNGMRAFFIIYEPAGVFHTSHRFHGSDPASPGSRVSHTRRSITRNRIPLRRRPRTCALAAPSRRTGHATVR